MQRKWAEEAGFSIVEVLVTAAVVGIAAVGLALLFGLGQGLVSAQGLDRVALYLATDKLEEARAQGFSAIIAGSATIACGKTPEPGVMGFPFDRDTEVTSVDPTTLKATGTDKDPCLSPVRAVQIKVTLTPQARQARIVTLTTVLMQH